MIFGAGSPIPGFISVSTIPTVNGNLNLGSAASGFNTLYATAAVIFNGANAGLSQQTETYQVNIAGGRAATGIWGAYINVFGKDHGTDPSNLYFFTGSLAGSFIKHNAQNSTGYHRFDINSTEVVRINSSGNLAFNSTTFSILGTSSDGSDNRTLQIGTGSAIGSSRSSGAFFYGNEVASVGGEVRLFAGNISTGHVTLQLTNTSAKIRLHNSADAELFAIPDSTTQSILRFSQATAKIIANTSDATDNATLQISGGGDYGVSRGAGCALYGNEVATVGGVFQVYGGNISTGHLIFSLGHSSAFIRLRNASDADMWTIDNSGNIIGNSSNHGQIRFNKTESYVCAGTSDGSDTIGLYLIGGGDQGPTRGGQVGVFGNEYAGSNGGPGAVWLRAGSVSSGSVYIDLNHASANVNIRNGTSSILQINPSGQITSQVTAFLIKQNTSDGTDNASIVIASGGASGDTRGGQVEMYGNEHANTGQVAIRAGNVTSGDITLITNGNVNFTVKKTENIAFFGAGSFGGGTKVISIGNTSAAPGSNPTGGGILYVESGALKYRGSSGTVTTLGNA